MTRTISVNGASFDVQEGANARFWERVSAGTWEPETFEIFDRFIDDDTLVIDFGAWIGPTVLYGAQKAAKAVAFEPDGVAFKELETNLAVNVEAEWAKRVEIFEEGIHPSGKPVVIGAPQTAGGSGSGILHAHRAETWTIETSRLQDVVAAHRGTLGKVFVKIDIEGGEYELLPDITDLLADPDCSFYISFHQKILQRSLKAKHASAEEADKEHERIIMATYDALPWERSVTMTNGKPFTRAKVKRRLRNGRPLPNELIVA